MKKLILILLISFLLFGCNSSQNKIELLILSGSNNHDWEETTGQLKKIFSTSDLFNIAITLQPDTLKFKHLKSFDVILSNWNSWPDNEIRWPEETENALIKFIKDGGGFVTFHASTSAFYNWDAFKKISTAAWIDSTWHGKPGATKVAITNSQHPVTKGLSGFYIFDELWVNAEENNDFTILGEATNEDISEKGIKNQPAIMVREFGKGRIFHTILGHDSRSMRNIGFQTLLLRGVEWAATGKVSSKIPQELRQYKDEKQGFKWLETDTTLALLNGENMVWQYNFRTKHGRPFFHPIFIGRDNLTCLSPDDHPWHLGQWFCWKYINGINYWEYHRGSYQSEGVTEVKNIEINKNLDYSAEIKLEIVYHPFEGENVLTEKRTVKVSPPQPNGKLWMDYDFTFKALADEVELNRTPILGQENGESWGGYAGLSVRFSQNFIHPEFITSWANSDSINGQNGDWLYMGFTGIEGEKVGSQIMVHPDSYRDGAGWYAINTEELPFYYFSPAYLFFKPLTMEKGEKINLNYKIIHFPGEVDSNQLKKEFHNYIYQ